MNNWDGHSAPEVPGSLLDRLFPQNRNIALATILGIWGAYFFFVSIRVFYVDLGNADAVFVQRILMTGICIVLTWCLYRMLIWAQYWGMAASILVIILPTVPIAHIAAIFDQIIFNHQAELFDFSHLFQSIDFSTFDWAYEMDEAFTRYFVFAGWAAFYLALSHGQNVQRMLEHSRYLERLNRDSEVRALRYQLNPHFVFNALNSVSSLVVDRKNEQAEKLVDDLADYMRTVLRDDGVQMISVEKEVEQQVRYLEIEQMRFPDRLHYEVHINDAVRNWKIPSLIIQPLIENAIKYGVARATEPVRIVISAELESERLKISVSNDGRMHGQRDEESGTGTGLNNIRERLAAIYGYAAALTTANSNEGMATASLVVPHESLAFLET